MEKMEEMTSSYIRRIKAHRKLQWEAYQKEFRTYSKLFEAGVISGQTLVEHLGLDRINE